MRFYPLPRAARRKAPPAKPGPVLFPRFRKSSACALLVLVGICARSAFVAGNDGAQTVRIEEDWEVEIGTPEPAGNAPQIINVFSPRQSLNGAYAVFEVNHSTQPTYSAGGMQLQCWIGDENVDYCSSVEGHALETADELISYTLTMSLRSDSLLFEVRNGQSETWGPFGDQEILRQAVPFASGTLAGYSPQSSVKNSRVGYARHRVKRYELKRVRYILDNGEVIVDDTPRLVSENSESE